MRDRWDIGGVSYRVYPQTGAPAIFIYNGHRGGVGVTEKGFALLDELLTRTLDAIRSCPCVRQDVRPVFIHDAHYSK